MERSPRARMLQAARRLGLGIPQFASERPAGKMTIRIHKVISGGQTGVDQAALRAAQACGVAIGGWCPPGRACDDGTIPEVFPLRETPKERSPEAPAVPRSQRTEWNVRDSDATLILCPAKLLRNDPGICWTAECALRSGKPLLNCDPTNAEDVRQAREWIYRCGTKVLNVAGPSERTSPGIGALAECFVRELLAPGPGSTGIRVDKD